MWPTEGKPFAPKINDGMLSYIVCTSLEAARNRNQDCCGCDLSALFLLLSFF